MGLGRQAAAMGATATPIPPEPLQITLVKGDSPPAAIAVLLDGLVPEGEPDKQPRRDPDTPAPREVAIKDRHHQSDPCRQDQQARPAQATMEAIGLLRGKLMKLQPSQILVLGRRHAFHAKAPAGKLRAKISSPAMPRPKQNQANRDQEQALQKQASQGLGHVP